MQLSIQNSPLSSGVNIATSLNNPNAVTPASISIDVKPNVTILAPVSGGSTIKQEPQTGGLIAAVSQNMPATVQLVSLSPQLSSSISPATASSSNGSLAAAQIPLLSPQAAAILQQQQKQLQQPLLINSSMQQSLQVAQPHSPSIPMVAALDPNRIMPVNVSESEFT